MDCAARSDRASNYRFRDLQTAELFGQSVLIAFSPFVQAVFKGDEYHKFALVLEKDTNVELLIELIETHP